MTPTITLFNAMSRKRKLYASMEIGYRYFNLDLACYWLRFRASWNAHDISRYQKRTGIGIDWNYKRTEFAPSVVPWEHRKHRFSYVDFE